MKYPDCGDSEHLSGLHVQPLQRLEMITSTQADKRKVERQTQTNRKPADERPIVTHAERSREVFALPQLPAASLCLRIHFHTFRRHVTTPTAGGSD